MKSVAGIAMNDDDFTVKYIDPDPGGGMKVGTIRYTVRMTHKPSGIVIEVPGYRSAHYAKMAAIEGFIGILTSRFAP